MPNSFVKQPRRERRAKKAVEIRGFDYALSAHRDDCQRGVCSEQLPERTPESGCLPFEPTISRSLPRVAPLAENRAIGKCNSSDNSFRQRQLSCYGRTPIASTICVRMSL